MTSARNRPSALAIGALGVVFGDIGTSPLYAFRESLAGHHDLAVVEENVLGVLSLMFWSLIIVITIKYLLIVMRADNHGEGGILALAALVRGHGKPAVNRVLILCAIFGTALLYGDGMITPAISVLSAVEGVEVAAPSVHDWVVPIVIVILIGLFWIQRQGTQVVGKYFGPVMLVWFTVLGVLGTVQIAAGPEVLRAIDPTRAVVFFAHHGFRGFLVMGSVFLVVTGGEALYADMGHFGRKPIASVWFVLVLPALLLNYFGQGALLLSEPEAIENPFFHMAPSWAEWPLTVLATAATVIASQALITGAFSLTVQAMHMGYLPRMRTVQTSADHRGQVYVPAVNWFLLVSCIGLVLAFGSSSKLAAAYGVAVTLTMVITTVLIAAVAKHLWGWPTWRLVLVLTPLLLLDLGFAIANLFKIPAGGWFPLLIGLIGCVVLTTWRTGREIVGKQLQRRALSVERFVHSLSESPPTRVAGTGVYLHRAVGAVPPALLTNLRQNAALHETIVLLSVVMSDSPKVPLARRATVQRHALGFHEVALQYGFMETTDVGRDLRQLSFKGLNFDEHHTYFFLGRERLEVTEKGGMAMWRERLFALMSRNASDPSVFFGLPRDRAVDIGTHLEI